MMTKSVREIARDMAKFAVPSRSTMTNWLEAAASSISSMIALSDGSVRHSNPGSDVSLAHVAGVRFGSPSMTVTEAPAWLRPLASTNADVLLPTPPLGLAKLITGMLQPSSSSLRYTGAAFTRQAGRLPALTTPCQTTHRLATLYMAGHG